MAATNINWDGFTAFGGTLTADFMKHALRADNVTPDVEADIMKF